MNGKKLYVSDNMDFKKLYWDLILGTAGGINRAKIIRQLKRTPASINQLAEILNVEYGTILHHIKILEEYEIIESSKRKYNKMYFLSDELDDNYDEFTTLFLKSFLDD
jgi:DNA-binding transcriptional ArsR family regulator